MIPPSSKISIWRATSINSHLIKRNELRFLVSVQMAQVAAPKHCSAQSPLPYYRQGARYRKIERNFRTYAAASADERISGRETISINATPVRFSQCSFCWMLIMHRLASILFRVMFNTNITRGAISKHDP